MIKKLSFLFIITFLVSFAQYTLAGTGEIIFVETVVDLQLTGKAIVTYTAQWRVISGELHGFYFESSDRLEISNISSDSYAVNAAGNRYNLDISNVGGGKWDIVLANGQGMSSGTVTYVFYFETDFFEAGYLSPTMVQDGIKLFVFNWSPVQWDEAQHQEYYTLKILVPEVLSAGEDVRGYVERNQLILTEPWVNQKFFIDYQKESTDRLEIIFHKKQPGNRFDMKTQFYMPDAWFKIPRLESEKLETEKKKKEKEDALKRFDESMKKNSVKEWPSIEELSANPFVYEGETVAMTASFSTMQTATQGIFEKNGEPFVVSDIPKGMFRVGGQVVVLAGKVLGNIEVKLPVLGLIQVPHLKFVGIHFCQDKKCSDIIRE